VIPALPGSGCLRPASPPPEEPRELELVFDRGTVVVKGAGPGDEVLQLPGMLWDPRVGAPRAPALCYPGIAARLGEASRRIADRVAISRAESLELPPLPLRDYQADAVAAWEIAGRRGVVVLPTGSGKTRVALAAITAVGQAALVLVPTRALLAQWRTVLRQSGVTRVGIHGDGLHELGPVTVCTFESAYRRMDAFGDAFPLVVVDEVHHFDGGLRSEALEMCAAPFRLGLTATPPLLPEGLARLERLVGPVVCSWSVQEMAGTHLAEFELLRLRVELEAEERARYRAAYAPFAEAVRTFFRAYPEGSWPDFLRAACAGPAGQALLAGYREAVRIVGSAGRKRDMVRCLLRRHVQDPVLIFTAGNDEAYALSRSLLVPAITCDIGAAERADVLERLRQGRLRCLVSARVLNEGIDLPEARVAIICGGRLGEREQVQRVGRVLRPGPGKRAVIYELVVRDTFEERQSERRQRGLLSREADRRRRA